MHNNTLINYYIKVFAGVCVAILYKPFSDFNINSKNILDIKLIERYEIVYPLNLSVCEVQNSKNKRYKVSFNLLFGIFIAA